MSRAEHHENKWLFLSLVAFLCAAAIFWCGFFVIRRVRENYVRYSADQVTARIISELKYTDFAKVEGGQLAKHYSIPSGVVDESSVYMSKSSESASELACFLLTDGSKYEALEQAVTEHIATRADGFKNLNPVQYGALKNRLIVRSGRYVLVAVGNNTAGEEKLFHSMVG
ncbi:MAG TPA: hypothetical protein DD433_06820 [Ruminococcaceae bacterium]|jgi:hypothetical protein|nr:hypothetical protein [Oscillospiraceae bacterium]